ncbi:MAG: hypothetical protein ACRCYO_12405 [Bacteroidia bacterium]
MDDKFAIVLILFAAFMFVLGIVQLILALIFTIRRTVNKTGARGWLYYWIGVGIYFVGLAVISIIINNEQDRLFDSISYAPDTSIEQYNEYDRTFNLGLERIQALDIFRYVWFFSANILAIYFFFAGKVSDRIFQKQNQFTNQH